jgi:hypothetical protein
MTRRYPKTRDVALSEEPRPACLKLTETELKLKVKIEIETSSFILWHRVAGKPNVKILCHAQRNSIYHTQAYPTTTQ